MATVVSCIAYGTDTEVDAERTNDGTIRLLFAEGAERVLVVVNQEQFDCLMEAADKMREVSEVIPGTRAALEELGVRS